MYIFPLIMNAKGKYDSPITTIKCFLINLIKMLSQPLYLFTVSLHNTIDKRPNNYGAVGKIQ